MDNSEEYTLQQQAINRRKERKRVGRWAKHLRDLKNIFVVSDDVDWDKLEGALLDRRLALTDEILGLQKGNNELAALPIAATDLFTEKAVIHLSQRAKVYTLYGFGALIACLGVIAIAIIQLYGHSIANYGLLRETKEISVPSPGHYLTMFLGRSLAISGLFATAIGILATLAYSFFHEATELYRARHQIRFGRLWVYMHYSQENPLAPSVDDFEKIFGLRLDYQTQFSKWKSPKGIVGEISDLAKAMSGDAVRLAEVLGKRDSPKDDENP